MNHFESAAKLLLLISTFDQTAPRESSTLVQTWGEMIAAAGFTWDELKAGAMRLYSRGGEPPKNKLGAVLAECRSIRRDEEARRPQLVRPVPKMVGGEPYQPSYIYAVKVPCRVCGAEVDEFCHEGGLVRRHPHMSRLLEGGKIHG